MAESTIMLPAALILLLIVFAVAALIGTNTGREIFGYLEKYLPGGGGSAVATPYYKIAKYSTDALICAVNAVAKGEENPCLNDYKESSILGGGKWSVGFSGNYGWLGTDYTSNALAYADGTSSNILDLPPVEKRPTIKCSFETGHEYGSDSILQYDEDGWFKSDGCYAYKGKAWVWKKAPCSDYYSEGWNPISTLFEYAKNPDNGMSGVHQDIANRLDGADYETGLERIAELINLDKAPISGDKTSDDNIRAIYPDGSASKWYGDSGDLFVSFDFSGQSFQAFGSANLARLMEAQEIMKESGCTLTNFMMPQYIGNAEEWIAGYGDPQFLLYFQSFPQGEDRAWSGRATWLENVGTVAMFAIPASKLFKGGVKGTGWAIKTGTESVVTKVGSSLTSAGTNLLASLTSKFSKQAAGRQLTFAFFEKGVSSAARKSVLETTLKDSKLFKELIWGAETKYGTAGMKAMLATAGVTTPIAWAAATVDSLNQKYEQKPSSLVLKQPFKDPETTMLDTYIEPGMSSHHPLGNQKYVLLDRTGWFEVPATFYLASPCHADLQVSPEPVYCRVYSYIPNTKQTYCEIAKQEDIERERHDGSFLQDIIQTVPNSFEKIYSGTSISSGLSKFVPYCGDIDVTENALSDRMMFYKDKDTLLTNKVRILKSWPVPMLDTADEVIMEDENMDGIFNKYQVKMEDGSIIKVDAAGNSVEGGLIDRDADGKDDLKFFYVKDGMGYYPLIVDVNTKEEHRGKSVYGSEGIEYYPFYYYGTNYYINIPVDCPDEGGSYDDCRFQRLFEELKIKEHIVTFGSGEIPDSSFYDLNNDGQWDKFESGTSNTLSIEDEIGPVVNSYYCKIDGITVKVDKSKYTNDEYNFCYSKPRTMARVGILAGSIVASAVLEYFSVGLLPQVAVGVVLGGAYFASQQYENWP